MILLLLVAVASEAHAQKLPEKIGPVSLSGSVGFSSELYGTQGIEARRDPFTSQLTANLTASAYRFSYGLNLVLSTQKSRLDRSFNRAGLDLAYKWIKVAGGNIAPTYGEYALRGTAFEGGLVELTPGRFMLGVTAGRATKAFVPETISNFAPPSFERWVYAVRLGYGDEQASHVHLVGVMVKDDSTSLERSLEGAPAPQQNLSLSPDLGLRLFGGALTWKAHGTVSVYTRDLYDDKVDIDEVAPDWVSAVYTPTLSTNIDYAGETDLRVRVRHGSLRASYERVQPGFESLGLQRPRRDIEVLRVQPQVTLFQRRLRVGGRLMTQRNNLLGLLTATRYRTQAALNVQMQLTDGFALALSGTHMDNSTRLSEGATRGVPRGQETRTLMVAPTWTVQRGGTSHTLGVNTSYQRTAEEQGRTVGATDERAVQRSNLTSQSATATYTVSLPTGLGVHALGSYLTTQASDNATSALNVNLNLNQAFLDRALTTTLGVTFARTSAEVLGQSSSGGLGDGVASTVHRYALNLSARYRVPFGGQLQLTTSALRAAPTAPRPAYNEVRARLAYTRRL